MCLKVSGDLIARYHIKGRYLRRLTFVINTSTHHKHFNFKFHTYLHGRLLPRPGAVLTAVPLLGRMGRLCINFWKWCYCCLIAIRRRKRCLDCILDVNTRVLEYSSLKKKLFSLHGPLKTAKLLSTWPIWTISQSNLAHNSRLYGHF